MNGNTVGLADMTAGVHNVVCKLSVIGEKQKPLGIAVKPSNRINSLLNSLQKLCNTSPVQLI